MVVADLASRFCLQERQRHQAFAKPDTEGESHRILIYAAPEIIGRGGELILELWAQQGSKGTLLQDAGCGAQLLCGFHGYCGGTWKFSSTESL